MADAAKDTSGLVLWVDADREVGIDILRVWEDVAKEGVWVGLAGNGTAIGYVSSVHCISYLAGVRSGFDKS